MWDFLFVFFSWRLFRLVLSACCGFSACFSSEKHTPCGFLLASSLKNTLFAPGLCDQLPVCVFSLAFLLKNTRHVVFCSLLLSKTHFSLHYISISFRFVFSARFSSEKHMPCGFPLASSRKNTLFTPLHIDQLPVCVFLLASSLKNTLSAPISTFHY